MSFRQKVTHFRGAVASVVFFVLMVVASNLQAQVRSATITGLVTDPTGAVIPGADVIVTETATNVSYPSKSDHVGLYTVPYLEAGDYTVKITKSGFEKFTVNNLHLDSAQTVRQDVKLTVGATTIDVEVNASTQSINTEDGTLSATTPAAVIDVIPNVTNNPFQYAQLQNGVIPGSATQSTTSATASFGVGVTGRSDFADFSIDGAQQGMNNIMIDGLPIMGGGYNDPTILPNLEGIQSVQILSNAYSAEYGHGAGQISITTKSGTNKFHGLVSYENRNEALMANTAANKLNLLENPTKYQIYRRPAFKVNDLGGEVDGPVLKDRLFFTSSFHYLSHNYGTAETLQVPTALERAGDFGSTLVAGATGQPTPVNLYNPFSVTPVAGATNVYQRAEFPKSTNCSSNPYGSYGCGDVIPNPSPYGLAILSLYPMPNSNPTSFTGAGNYLTTVTNTLTQYTNSDRVDWKRGRHSVYGSGGIQWDTLTNPNVFGAGNVKGFNDVGLVTFDRNYYSQIGDTVVFSPTLIMDLRVGAVRDHTAALGGVTSGFTNYSGLGVSSATQALFAEQGSAPVLNPGTWQNLTPDSQFANKQEHQINWSANGSVTKIKGNFTFKAGAQFQVILHNYNDFEEASTNLGGCCSSDVGNYTANFITATGSPVNSSPYNTIPQQQGYAGALTLVNEGVWFVRPGANLKPAYASKYFAVYSQNDWKVTHKLTLNLGVRWEVQPAITERYNRLAGYDLSKPNALYTGTMGAIDFPGTNGYGRGLWDTEWNNWSPHLGFAYRLRPRTVARGGFAIQYMQGNTGFYSSPNDYGEATWASGNTGSLTYGANPNGTPTETINQAAPLIAATGSNVLAPQTYGVNEAYFPRNFQIPIQQQYNITLETSFGAKSQWLFSTGTAGTRENHLFTRNLAFENIQSISASAPGTLQSWRNTWINSNGSNQQQTANVTNPYQPSSGPLLPLQNALANATIQQFIPYLPYPLLYGGSQGLDGSTGFASYDSLQTHFAHRSTALYLDVNYTWSKSLGFVNSIVGSGNISTPDLLCNRCNRNYESQDTPHRVVVTAIYQSPFSKGQKWGGDNRVVSALLGGWSLSPVFLAQDGNPITLSGLSGQFTGRINYAGEGKGSVPLVLPKSYQKIALNSTTKVTLPCGIQVTQSLNNRMKFNPCAFGGPTVITPNGTILADEYWTPNGNQTNGNIRGHSRVNVDLSVRRTFNLTERFKLDLTAAMTNLMNSAEWNTSPTGAVGSTDTINNPGNGQIVGLATGGTYGQWGTGTYDPRQIELVGRIVF